VIDLQGRKAWAFPLVVVGMNSIAMYCMAQLLKPWVGKTLRTHLTTADAVFHTQIVPFFFSDDYAYAAIWRSLAVLMVLWLVCLWMYRRKIFVRI
jgi:predicted acyltransferase